MVFLFTPQLIHVSKQKYLCDTCIIPTGGEGLTEDLAIEKNTEK